MRGIIQFYCSGTGSCIAECPLYSEFSEQERGSFLKKGGDLRCHLSQKSRVFMNFLHASLDSFRRCIPTFWSTFPTFSMLSARMQKKCSKTLVRSARKCQKIHKSVENRKSKLISELDTTPRPRRYGRTWSRGAPCSLPTSPRRSGKPRSRPSRRCPPAARRTTP